jgi:hypothetical protein
MLINSNIFFESHFSNEILRLLVSCVEMNRALVTVCTSKHYFCVLLRCVHDYKYLIKEHSTGSFVLRFIVTFKHPFATFTDKPGRFSVNI